MDSSGKKPLAAVMQEAVPPGSPRVAVRSVGMGTAVQPGDADLGALARELERIRSMDPHSFGDSTRLGETTGRSAAFASADSSGSPMPTWWNKDARSPPFPSLQQSLSPTTRRVGETRVVRRKSQDSPGEQRSTTHQTSCDVPLRKDSKLVSGGWQAAKGCMVSKAFLPALSSEILHFTNLNAMATRPQPWSSLEDKEAELAAAAQPSSAKNSALVHPAALVAVPRTASELCAVQCSGAFVLTVVVEKLDPGNKWCVCVQCVCARARRRGVHVCVRALLSSTHFLIQNDAFSRQTGSRLGSA